jgi:potassium-transporting ATPase KdpC subunit
MNELSGTDFDARERGPRDGGGEAQGGPSHAILRPAITLLILMTVITGIAYPLLVTGVAQVLFARQAAGSLIVKDGKPVGSRLIGQPFSDPKYFWSRPSATSPQPYNGLSSGGSNLGPLNPALIDAVKARIAALHAADPMNHAPIPVDLVTASASGLDPDISLAAAYYQADRVARVRRLDPARVRALIAAHARRSLLGVLGSPRVNVLELNLAVDALK